MVYQNVVHVIYSSKIQAGLSLKLDWNLRKIHLSEFPSFLLVAKSESVLLTGLNIIQTICFHSAGGISSFGLTSTYLVIWTFCKYYYPLLWKYAFEFKCPMHKAWIEFCVQNFKKQIECIILIFIFFVYRDFTAIALKHIFLLMQTYFSAIFTPFNDTIKIHRLVMIVYLI